jgi:hypothetical protein
MNLVVICNHKFGISRARYGEILYEKSLLTLGQLKRELNDFLEGDKN